ncbi:hypothetical protein GGF41_001117 [Coemansia sp. RSA 2531]|nr:hypothetical protein GGF41_001117 [Coemansia sp. RSA 2531]
MLHSGEANRKLAWLVLFPDSAFGSLMAFTSSSVRAMASMSWSSSSLKALYGFTGRSLGLNWAIRVCRAVRVAKAICSLRCPRNLRAHKSMPTDSAVTAIDTIIRMFSSLTISATFVLAGF